MGYLKLKLVKTALRFIRGLLTLDNRLYFAVVLRAGRLHRAKESLERAERRKRAKAAGRFNWIWRNK